ncbi:MAG: histidine kinase [Rikenellaceae bacterium]
MLVKLLFIIAIIVQSVAIIFALRLVRVTKYNAIWILFILGFIALSVERYLQLIAYNGVEVSSTTFIFSGFVVSIGLSIGVMYAHKLFLYIERINHQRSLISRRILSAVLHTEERSRSRVSKELHDGLGPLLSAAKMSLSALSQCQTEQERRDIVAKTNFAIDEAIRSVREISNNLSPQMLNDFGLNRAISRFVSQSLSHHAVKIDYRENLGANRYGSDLELILYRVVCELIGNSLKHSGCREISLSIYDQNETIEITYSDDGVGFDSEALVDCGLGLSNISSRINTLNGTFQISSSVGNGMSATIVVNTTGEGTAIL